MITLSIDTALNACSAALVHDGQVLGSRVEVMARGQAERLALLVAEAMEGADIGFDQLDRIGVTRGPGTFTGLRVGLAFARGLALALGKPCVGFSTLEVLAHGASQPKIVAAISVAGSLFVGAWEGRRVVLAPCRGEAQDIVGQLAGDWAVTGPGASAIVALRPDWLHVAQDTIDPIVLAHLGAQADPESASATPLYLRGVDAKLAGGIVLDQGPS
jgi:tRNA threonylcarbamoyladenosine biosynthesis protein TsaB